LSARTRPQKTTPAASVRTNAAARSIVISCDTGAIAPDLWQRLVNSKKDPSLRSSLKEELGRLSRPELDSCGP
jgi:hypothetical protein